LWILTGVNKINTSPFLPKLSNTRRNNVAMAVAVFLIAATPRVLLALMHPVQSPDGTIYLNVALNMIWNGCVSMSDAITGVCIPHWGGNHLPGYPAFIAALGADISLVLIVQALLVAGAIAWLAVQVGHWTGKPMYGAFAAMFVALSPIHLAWTRFLLPDALTVAVIIWILAEIIRGFRNKQLPILSLGLALSAACWLRYDGVLVCFAVAAGGFYIHAPKEALKRGFLIAMIVATPLVGWSLRSAALGLSWFPQPRFMYDGSYTPGGFLAWGGTWITNLPQGAGFGYNLGTKSYDRILIDTSVAYSGPNERAKVEKLMGELIRFTNQDFPRQLDEQFLSLARERRTAEPFNVWIVVPLKRALSFWLSPVASMGWPLEISKLLTKEQKDEWNSGGIAGKLSVVSAFPLQAFGKAMLLIYRAVLIFATIYLAIVLSRGPPSVWNRVATVAIFFVVIRTGALSYQTSIDPRYMAPAQAALEIAVGVLLMYLHSRRHSINRVNIQ
jgi:hypothetical protein